MQEFEYQWTLLLTGTPIQNNAQVRGAETASQHPSAALPLFLSTDTSIVSQELFSLLHILDPDRWENWHAFSREFCGGKDRPQNAEQVG